MARRNQEKFFIVYRITGTRPEDDNDESFAQSHATRQPMDTTAECSGTYGAAPATWRAARRAATRARPRPPARPVPGSNARPSTTCWPCTRRPWSRKTATGCRPCSPRRRRWGADHGTALRQDPPGALTAPGALQDTLRATFQQATVTALVIPPETVVRLPPTRAVSPSWRSKVPSTRGPWRSTPGCIAPPGGSAGWARAWCAWGSVR